MSWRWIAFYRGSLNCLSNLEWKGGRHIGLFIAGLRWWLEVLVLKCGVCASCRASTVQ